MAKQPINVTVWNEGRHEKTNKKVAKIYPKGMHGAIAAGLTKILGDQVNVTTATLDDPEQGMPDSLLDKTDVLAWWGHGHHEEVEDDLVTRIQTRVHHGMGLVVLHSGHFSKIFKRLLGTGCGLKWREAAEREILWNVNPGHPITDGIGDHIDLPHVEMYGELFDIPEPDELIFISWFEGGDVFRSGCTFTRGKGRIFYFRPGHETFPLYHNEQVLRVIANGVNYVAPRSASPYAHGGFNIAEPLSPITSKE